MNGTGLGTGRKNFDVKLRWEGENKSQFRNKNTIQHLQKAVINKPSSAEEGWADWTAASLGDKATNTLGACESGLGIPLRPQHKGHQHCKLRLRDPLFFPLAHLHMCAHRGTE